jgi:hypothetical protein
MGNREMEQKNIKPDDPAAAGMTINCSHPEPQSWVRGRVAEMDQLSSLPVKPVAWLQRVVIICMTGFILCSLLGGIAILAKINGRGTGHLFAVCFGHAILFIVSTFVAVWLCRCPICDARLKKHWGMCCEWTPGKKGDRLLLECSSCRVMWDAGKWGGGSTTPG